MKKNLAFDSTPLVFPLERLEGTPKSSNQGDGRTELFCQRTTFTFWYIAEREFRIGGCWSEPFYVLNGYDLTCLCRNTNGANRLVF